MPRTQDLLGFGVLIVALVVLLGISVFLLESIKDQTTTYATVNNETVNKSFTTTPHVVTTDKTPVKSDSETLWLYNTSSNYVAQLTKSDNYTVKNYGNGEFNITNTAKKGTDINVNATYQHETSTNTTGVIETGVSGLQDFANWVPILVIGFIAVLIIGILVSSLTGFASGGGGRV